MPNFSSFYNYIAIWNVVVGVQGGVAYTPVAGGKTYPAVKLNVGTSLTDFAHEMGHGYTLGHSFNDAPCEYCDPWDIMSANNVKSFSSGLCVDVPVWKTGGFVSDCTTGPGLNLWNRMQLGWSTSHAGGGFAGTGVFVTPSFPNSYDKSITIAARNHPEINLSTGLYVPAHPKYGYTVEFMTPEGWEQGIGVPTLQVHRVYPADPTPYAVTASGNLQTDFSHPFVEHTKGGVRIALTAIAGGQATVHVTYGPMGLLGDVDGDNLGDIALTGGAGWGSIPVAFSKGDGSFRVTNTAVTNFPAFAQQQGAVPVAGDFDGDGKTDLALTGGHGWGSIPVAFSKGDGSFRVTNTAVTDFPVFAAQPGAKPIAADVDGDGRTDIVLTGGQGWGSVPVAFSNGDGSFRVTNIPVTNFPVFAAQSGAIPVAGDFDDDGKTDIALTGGVGWGSIPVAFSNGDGSFRVTNTAVTDFPTFAQQSGALPVAGDFNGDGSTDLALTAGNNWGSVPVAFSNGDGSFRVTNTAVTNFPAFAQQGAQVVTTDLDGDGRFDLALTGGSGWNTIPVAFSNANGSFRVTNTRVSNFPTFAAQLGARAVSATEAFRFHL